MKRTPKHARGEAIYGTRRPTTPLRTADSEQLVSAVLELARRMEAGESPPPYFMAPLRRFAKAERERWDRVIAANLVRRAAEEGYPVKRDPRSRAVSAFDVAAARIGTRSAAWCEDAYYRPSPRK